METGSLNQKIDCLVVAFATIDGSTIPKEHFGHAEYFTLYQLSKDSAALIESFQNTNKHRHSTTHQYGEKKGPGIDQLMAAKGVQVLVAREYGPNIKRMRSRYVPIIIKNANIKDAIENLQDHWELVQSSWNQGDTRKHLNLR